MRNLRIGRFFWYNGSVYEGLYKQGSENGYGRFIYSDGQVYTGFWVNGHKQGIG